MEPVDDPKIYDMHAQLSEAQAAIFKISFKLTFIKITENIKQIFLRKMCIKFKFMQTFCKIKFKKRNSCKIYYIVVKFTKDGIAND